MVSLPQLKFHRTPFDPPMLCLPRVVAFLAPAMHCPNGATQLPFSFFSLSVLQILPFFSVLFFQGDNNKKSAWLRKGILLSRKKMKETYTFQIKLSIFVIGNLNIPHLTFVESSKKTKGSKLRLKTPYKSFDQQDICILEKC